MPSAVPVIWKEPTNHATDHYFCMVPPIKKGVRMKKKCTMSYPNIPSAILPMTYGKRLLIPEPPENFSID
jgi:hypothetical protein